MIGSLEITSAAISGWLSDKKWPLVVGICGAQGSGKSSLSAELAQYFNTRAIAVEVLSLDDLYLPPERRPVDVHPLFATRGVPGTHDVQLGIDTLEAMFTDKPVAIPRFDKANDAPFSNEDWPMRDFPADIILLEGWCVGASPQPDADLIEPVNDLERQQDPEGVWRRAVNEALKGPYATLFSHIDRLILLAAPGFDIVRDWRIEQENTLRARLKAEGRTGARVMSDAEVGRFIQHYERLTRHILQTMPAYADLTLQLDSSRNMKPSPKY